MGGIIMGAIGGAGEGLEAYGAKQQTTDAANEIEQLRATLDQQKTDSLHAYADRGNIAAKSYLLDAANMQVPVSAAPVTSLTGADPNAPDPTPQDSQGFTGDPAAMRAQIIAMPDTSPDKAPMLAQLNRQVGTDTAANQGIVAGQMRDQTTSEMIDSAHDAAVKAGDVNAATAIKGMSADKFTKIGANEMVLDRNGRIMVTNTAGAEMAAAHDASSERRANTRADATESAAQIRADASTANMQARIDSMTIGMNKVQSSAWIQQVDRLKAMGKSDEEALDYMGESKHKPDEALILSTAATMQANGLKPPKGDITDPAVYAVQKAKLALDTARGASIPTITGANPSGQGQMHIGANRPPIGSFNK